MDDQQFVVMYLPQTSQVYIFIFIAKEYPTDYTRPCSGQFVCSRNTTKRLFDILLRLRSLAMRGSAERCGASRGRSVCWTISAGPKPPSYTPRIALFHVNFGALHQNILSSSWPTPDDISSPVVRVGLLHHTTLLGCLFTW